MAEGHVITRRRFLAGVGAVSAGLVIEACGGSTSNSPSSPGGSLSGAPSQPPSRSPWPTASASPSQGSPSSSPGPSSIPLRAKIAQMLLVGFRGLAVDDRSAIVADIAERSLGGVVLFDRDQPTGGSRNVASPQQVRRLVASLKERAPAGLPLLVAVDEEGGAVDRLSARYGFPATLSAAALGSRDDPAYTRAAGASIAKTLRSAGIDLNLAPVVDLDVNPRNPIIGALGRSFGADPSLVTAQALAFIAGHHDEGVGCTLKHFPGHGSSTGDTHLGTVDVTGTWTRQELQPFEAIAAAGQADAVMTAHVFDAKLDADYPATLSRGVVTGLLRDQVGFDGVVISDDMQMGAIRKAFGYERAIELAIGAGIDLLTIANQQVYDDTIAARTIDIVEALVRSGRIAEDRIDASFRRIIVLKARLVEPAGIV